MDEMVGLADLVNALFGSAEDKCIAQAVQGWEKHFKSPTTTAPAQAPKKVGWCHSSQGILHPLNELTTS